METLSTFMEVNGGLWGSSGLGPLKHTFPTPPNCQSRICIFSLFTMKANTRGLRRSARCRDKGDGLSKAHDKNSNQATEGTPLPHRVAHVRISRHRPISDSDRLTSELLQVIITWKFRERGSERNFSICSSHRSSVPNFYLRIWP